MVTFPSTLGGGNWNGLAYDAGARPRLHQRDEHRPGGADGVRQGSPQRAGRATWLRSARGAAPVGRFWNPENKIPCSAPPFGELVAVDVNTRRDRLEGADRPRRRRCKAKGFANTGALNIGGTIATASGLLFIGATNDARFRAFDSADRQASSGRRELEASAHSIPLTFLGKDGRQYVVVAAGGGSFLGSPNGTKIVAFALPEAH